MYFISAAVIRLASLALIVQVSLPHNKTDYKTNAQISKELKTTPILDKLLEYN